ncbi:MAG TPA: MFS transporter [Pseudonocardia sp.]|uniref:MFS transporter n=1 Tax=Pseudonocardia sp. TaxID=60912 RepID=UPI002B4B66D2|nr:MFS transporter [Pseudonocardia sp.]HLU56500.1 MFS transporter [Pseudonocardia sp.]
MSGLLLPVLYSGTFVQLMSVTVLQVAVPAVRADLSAGPGAAQLVVAGYTLTFACSLITAARLGDRYGYRRLFAMGMAVFTLAAAAGAAAPDASVLVAARLVQGLGSGLMAPQILSIVQTAVPAARRARAMAGYGATMAVASLAGPVLGGFLLELDPFGLGWRAAMALTVPVGAAALALAPALPPGGATGAGQRVDGLGACLSLSGLLLLVLPLTVGGDQGWPAWVWASLAASAALLAAFVAVQRRVAHPLVHRAALSGRTTRWGIAGILLFNAGVPSFVLLLSLHLQGALRLGPLATALTITPYAVGALLGSGLAEAAARRWGARLLAGSAGALGLVALLTAALIGSPGPALWAVLATGGVAFGAFTACAFALVLGTVPAAAAGSVSGLLPTAQQLGGTFGVALAGVAYTAPAATAGAAFAHAMGYEAVVFALAAGAGVVLHRAAGAGRPRPAGGSPRRGHGEHRQAGAGLARAERVAPGNGIEGERGERRPAVEQPREPRLLRHGGQGSGQRRQRGRLGGAGDRRAADPQPQRPARRRRFPDRVDHRHDDRPVAVRFGAVQHQHRAGVGHRLVHPLPDRRGRFGGAVGADHEHARHVDGVAPRGEIGAGER